MQDEFAWAPPRPSTGRPRMDVVRRLESKIEKRANGHWTWKGARNNNRSPAFANNQGQSVQELVKELIGHEYKPNNVSTRLVEACGYRFCLNPEHLRWAEDDEVELREDLRRLQKRKDHIDAQLFKLQREADEVNEKMQRIEQEVKDIEAYR